MSEDRPLNPKEKRTEEARHSLERMKEEGGLFGTSGLGQQTDRLRKHFAGEDAPKDDGVEIWGRRVGRILAVAFVLYLIWWLLTKYG